MTNPTTNRLETETCSRCGGTGTYSYCQMYGRTCFKCAGRKVVFTKKGAAAAAYLQRLYSKTTLELEPGDKIKNDGLFGGPKWMAIKEVFKACPERSSACSIVNGERVYSGYDVVTEHTHFGGCAPDKLFRVAQTAAQKTEKIALALAYQETLTKQGKPRKTKAQLAEVQ